MTDEANTGRTLDDGIAVVACSLMLTLLVAAVFAVLIGGVVLLYRIGVWG